MSNDHPVGNKSDHARGKGIKDGTAIGQKIPKKVLEKIQPKEEK